MGVDAGAGHHKLVETLLELHKTQRSCVVRIERGPVKRQLVLARGLLDFAESNLPKEHLAHVLIGLDLLARRDLQKVSALMKSGLSSDEAVVQATALDDKRLAEAVHEQAVMILASVFASSGYSLRLFGGEGLISRRCRLALPLPQALVEAARRAVGEHRVPASCLPGSALISANPLNDARASLPLNGAEAHTYAQVQGLTPIAHLLPMPPTGTAKPEALVQCLLLLGLLRLETAEPEQAAATAGLQEGSISVEVDDLLRRFEVANFYEILSLPSDARDDDIKSAYHKMARRYHPDRFESRGYSAEFRTRVERLFTYITGAYTTLGDAGARAAYDEMRMKKESRVEATLQGRAAVDADKEKMAETLFRAGRSAMKQRAYEKAVSQLRECVWLRPDTARYHFYLGVAQTEIGALRKEAEQHLLQAISLEFMNPDCYVQLGKLYLKVNLPKKAEVQFREALRWDSENAEALKMLGELGKK